MDSGAYGSYPGYLSRKRYRRGGLRLGRRTYNYRSRFRLPRNPMNQFTYRKTRVGRLTKTQLVSVKCTSTNVITLNPGGTYQFQGIDAYFNLTAMLATSPEFVSRYTQYSYYMINGMQVKFTRKWIDPIAYGVNGTSPGFIQASYGNGLPMLSCNFYPNLSGSTVGQPVEDADSSWKVSPFIQTVQSHYQPFPKNFTTGSNSNGLGVWNACSTYTSLSGELAIYNDAANTAGTSDISTISMWDVEVNLYIAFCNNTGS